MQKTSDAENREMTGTEEKIRHLPPKLQHWAFLEMHTRRSSPLLPLPRAASVPRDVGVPEGWAEALRGAVKTISSEGLGGDRPQNLKAAAERDRWTGPGAESGFLPTAISCHFSGAVFAYRVSPRCLGRSAACE